MRPNISAQGLIVVLTGAGISQESGLDTFRCADGIWSKYDLEDVATPQGFRRNPDLVHQFYNHRRAELQKPSIQPNPAHYALAELEQNWPGGVLTVTQNIDDLHERAGSRRVVHMHGELLKSRCSYCRTVREWRQDMDVSTPCPACGHAGGLRPHVVWFGEIPLFMDDIQDALDHCALFVSVGTSGHVYPAAGFVQSVRQRGQAHTLELNLDPSEGASRFAETRYGPASQLVPDFVASLLRGVNTGNP